MVSHPQVYRLNFCMHSQRAVSVPLIIRPYLAKLHLLNSTNHKAPIKQQLHPLLALPAATQLLCQRTTLFSISREGGASNFRVTQ
jgi:hypothetical protein